MQHRPISTSATMWFLRGFLAGGLVCGAANAASYFFWSDGWGDLLGRAPQRTEAIGFPLRAWHEEGSFGRTTVDPAALGLNLAFAAAVGLVCGAVIVARRRPLNRIVADVEKGLKAETETLRFSLRGLLGATAFAAVLAAGLRHFLARRPELLGGIYLFGPWLLVALALLPRGIAWQQRVLILTPAAALLIGVAVLCGRSLQPPVVVDKVLLGIFVCWTPPSALAAVLLTGAFLLWHSRQRRRAGT
jgi:hypothetical protein